MRTNRFILDKAIEVPKPSITPIKLDESYASYLYENSEYKEFTSIEYIQERLRNDISAGILIDNKLVAWGLCHDDGAIGFLHVLGEYRRKGLGHEILLNLINQKRLANKTVFCNITASNSVSQRMVSNLGFRFDRGVSWLKLE